MLMEHQATTATTRAAQAGGSVLLIRFYVGLIFVIEGALKYLRPDTLGPGRFAKVGIVQPVLLANLDGLFEIGCGVMILVGLLTRLAVLPMIVDMIGAITTTKLPLLWGSAALYPGEHGLWDFLHESRLEWAMLCGSAFLLFAGAGRLSLDAKQAALFAR